MRNKKEMCCRKEKSEIGSKKEEIESEKLEVRNRNCTEGSERRKLETGIVS